MKIFVDGRDVTLSGTCFNLQDVLQEIVESQADRNRVVWSVKVNEEDFSERRPHDAEHQSVADIRMLEIGTMDSTEICHTFLRNSGLILDCLCKGADRISELFRLEDQQEANKHYGNFLESCQAFFAMLHQSEVVLRLDLQAFCAQGTTLRKKLRDSAQVFDNMLTAQKKKDWVMLADLLKFELSPLLKECKGAVESFAA